MTRSAIFLAALLACSAARAQQAPSASDGPADRSPYFDMLNDNTATAIDIQESHHSDGSNGG